MKRWKWILVLSVVAVALLALTTSALAAVPSSQLVDICTDLYAGVFGVPNGEPLGVCQWDLAIINATDSGSYATATGAGVTVGMIDSGVQTDHPDIAPNLDLDRSCSFIYDDTPTADPSEIANGDCSQQGRRGRSERTRHPYRLDRGRAGQWHRHRRRSARSDHCRLESLHPGRLCFADSVAAALRYAGDHDIDIVNLSLFADPYLYYCKSDKEQKAILKELENAAKYAQQHGVLIVASAGNEQADLQHPVTDELSPDWPPDTEETRYVKNNCRVAPAELPGVLTVSATGPVGYPGYDLWIADYSSVGMSRVDVAAPGGDYFRATGTVQDAVLGAIPIGSALWNAYDPLQCFLPWVHDHGWGRGICIP